MWGFSSPKCKGVNISSESQLVSVGHHQILPLPIEGLGIAAPNLIKKIVQNYSFSSMEGDAIKEF